MTFLCQKAQKNVKVRKPSDRCDEDSRRQVRDNIFIDGKELVREPLQEL